MAVKVYHKKMHENFNIEYTFLKNLSHQNIVKFQGVSEDINYFFLEIEYCMTGDLSKCLWQNKNSKVIYIYLII
jgi:serine/threonine protein kinase